MRNTDKYIEKATAITEKHERYELGAAEMQAIHERALSCGEDFIYNLIWDSWRFGFECGRRYEKNTRKVQAPQSVK